MVYVPKLLPNFKSFEDAEKFLADEYLAIARELQLEEYKQLKVLHASPAKPRRGLLAYADGTDWNPGSGEGLYRHNGTIWVFVG